MGFLNEMLNPLQHLKNTGQSLSNLSHGDIAGTIDPGHKFIGSSPKTDPSIQPGMQPGMTDPSQYAGDQSDPSYGSFNQPFDVEQFYNYADPGYAFQLQQGNQALQNSAAAGSGALSGAALKDLLKYNQDYAGTAYNDAFNRYQTQQGNIFNRLYQVAGLGQNAAANVGNQGTTLAGNAGQFTSNAGAAEGAGIVGAGNTLGQGATNYWLMQQFMKSPQPVASAGAGGV